MTTRSQSISGFTLVELLVIIAIVAILAALPVPALSQAKDRGQTPAPTGKPKGAAAISIVVDKVVVNPKKFKGTINVAGQVGNAVLTNGLFVLTCEDACASMPVKFPGTPPQPGTDVVVRGQIAKDAKGRYVFEAESVTAKK